MSEDEHAKVWTSYAEVRFRGRRRSENRWFPGPDGQRGRSRARDTKRLRDPNPMARRVLEDKLDDIRKMFAPEPTIIRRGRTEVADQAKQWLEEADTDLTAAELLENGPHAHSAFFCQQVATEPTTADYMASHYLDAVPAVGSAYTSQFAQSRLDDARAVVEWFRGQVDGS